MKILGFHACKKDGGWCYVWNNSPFISGDNVAPRWQWLTKGYYFWTDSDLFAHQWGIDRYNSSYAIVKCDIEIPSEKLLDLVGNVSDAQYFSTLLDMYCNKHKKASNGTPQKEPSVSAVIEHYRSKTNIWYHDAVKSYDTPPKHARVVKFTPRSSECTTLVLRQQLCVFENAKSYIGDPTVVYPECFAEKMSQAKKEIEEIKYEQLAAQIATAS